MRRNGRAPNLLAGSEVYGTAHSLPTRPLLCQNVCVGNLGAGGTMRLIAVFACTVLLISFGVLPGHAQKRVALVVGNDIYANLPADQQLRKAVNDAHAVGDALGSLGFEVIRGENLGRQALVDKLNELTRRLAPGDIAFFFFAGHGVAISGGNFTTGRCA
jgi:hypothetical protein